ncbi:MAG: 50S ribosomal protein L35ae [Candidatus Aenigmatarchaeota archaeon]
MKATIISYRRGAHTMHGNQLLIEIEGVNSKELAARYIGKRVVWTTPAKKKIFGKIVKTHGNNGVLRARFPKGLPGTAMGTKVEIVER